MEITPNWPQIAGAILLQISVIALAVPPVRNWWRSRKQSAQTDIAPQPQLEKASRKSDEKPPSGAVAWVLDITDAMGQASPESVLFALKTGYTRDEAREMRIVELESAKKGGAK